MSAKDITLDIVKKWFTYDKDSGKLTRIARPYKSTAQLGEVNSNPNVKGYHVVRVFIPSTGKSEKGFEHRMAYMLSTDSEIEDGMQVDHIDGNRANNKFSNLRLVTTCENSKNKRRYINNMSGKMGIVWCRYNFWWEIYVGQKYIGKHEHFREAIKIRESSIEYKSYHDNHGREEESTYYQ